MAPELIEKKIYDGVKVDIFAIGIILFITVSGRFPFESASLADERYKCIYDGDFDDYWALVLEHKSFSLDFKDLFLKLVSYEYRDRLNISEIRRHPWMV
jgi:serine/threonine protein kinase